jgi:hypothetical protein
MLNSGTAELLDLPRLQSQLLGLERRTARGGHDSIDHARGGHDDVANAAAGALTMTAGRGKITWSAVAGDKTLSTGNAESHGQVGAWPRPVGLHERPLERLWPTG